MLREKQPLVVEDRVQNIQDIRASWFKYVITKDVTVQGNAENPQWITNKFKYLVIHAPEDSEILLFSANEKLQADGTPPAESTLVAIQLKQNQILIIPYRMHYAVSTTAHINALGVHDYVTYFLP